MATGNFKLSEEGVHHFSSSCNKSPKANSNCSGSSGVLNTIKQSTQTECGKDVCTKEYWEGEKTSAKQTKPEDGHCSTKKKKKAITFFFFNR